MKHKIIQLWSGPRNISTAFMYSFAQRNDTRVLDEPLYAHYLVKSGIEHPGREEVLQSQENDGTKVMQKIISDSWIKPVLFCKQMTHHLVDIDLNFLKNSFNLLLIRNPKQVLISYSKVIAKPQLSDISIKQNFDLYHYLKENNFHYLVIDSNELLKNSEKLLHAICIEIGIEFQPSMLKWKAGPKQEDGVWAKYWYENVHRSAGFEPIKEKETQMSSHLEKIYIESKPYYDFLYHHSLKA
jgi:hypothetical protein